MTDGPYILLSENGAEVFTIQPKENKGYSIIKSEVEKSRGYNTSLTCMVDNKKEKWDIEKFEFNLYPLESFKDNPDEYDLPEKLLAISDIEGNFYALQSFLLNNSVIDEGANWIFGKNAIVIVGDLIDRSYNVLPCLWLIYKLDGQAKQYGGRVHYLLGNHELMNFRNDFRYVHSKYFSTPDVEDLYTSLFKEGSVLGDWILTKNSVEKIGNFLFVHGGISKPIIDNNFSVREINDIVRNALRKKSRNNLDKSEIIVASVEGPLWFRGLVQPNSSVKIMEAYIDSLARYFLVNTIVVGHSVVPKIKGFYDNKLIAIDLIHPETQSHLPIEGLLIEGEEFFIVDDKKNKSFLR